MKAGSSEGPKIDGAKLEEKLKERGIKPPNLRDATTAVTIPEPIETSAGSRV